MIGNYINIGIYTLINFVPIVFIIYLIIIGIKFIVKREIKIKFINIVCEFALILIVLCILQITGIIFRDYSMSTNIYFDYKIFENGVSPATLLNCVLFIPFGFLLPTVFKKIQNKLIIIVMIGFCFSLSIEIIQMFTGRFAELEDVLMNTLGTFIGYEIFVLISKMFKRIL